MIFSTVGLPRVRVPVLSNAIVPILAVISRMSPPRKRIPRVAAFPEATRTAVGVASPSAQGQATIRTETALRSAAAQMGNIVPQDTNKGNQLNKESAEMASSSQPQSNMQITKGGTNNVNTANNTYTTILEDTNTSDRNLRSYLNA